MKTGMSTACFFCKLYNEDAVREIARLGVKEIEIFFSARMEYQKAFTDEIKRICDGEGIRVRSVHSLCTQFEPQLFSDHGRQFEEALCVYHEVLDAAANLGAEVYVFHGAMYLKRAKTFRLDYEWVGERISLLAEQAKENQVKLAYENVHWCWYHEPGFAKELLRYTSSDNLYFTLDIKQAAQSGHDVFAYMDDMGDRLAHVHVCDFKKDPQKGIIPCLPFAGEMDWQGMKERLAQMNFDGMMMLEVYPADYSSYDELLENYGKVEAFFR